MLRFSVDDGFAEVDDVDSNVELDLPDPGDEAVAPPPGSVAWRRVPLLRVTQEAIVDGTVLLAIDSDGATKVRVELGLGWSRAHGGAKIVPLKAKPELPPEWYRTAWGRPAGADPEALATAMAKAFAERTRNEIRHLRGDRSRLEAALSAALRNTDDATTGTRDVLASLIELARIDNRVREACQAGVREGLGLAESEEPVYRLYRLLRDPTLIRSSGEPDPVTAPQPAWLRQHDAAVRQLEAAAELVSEEAQQIYGLLDGASTIAALRDADSQDHLNRFAAVAGVGLGIPGLIFGLYSANVLVPFTRGGRQLLVLGLIFVATLAVLAVVLARLPQSASEKRKAFGLATLIAVAVALVLFAVASINPTPP